MSKNADDAAAMFLEGYNCAQAVLACCGRDRGMPRELAIRVAQAFGGGIGKTGGLCGAVSGGLMTLGLQCAALEGSDAASKAKAAQMAQTLMNEFARRHGTLLCRELTGCDLRAPEGMKRFQEIDAHHTLCPKFVRDAAEIVEEVLTPKGDPQ